MIRSRTRNDIQNYQSFLKEAGIDRDTDNIYEKVTYSEAKSKKSRMSFKKKHKFLNHPKSDSKSSTDKVQSDVSEDNPKQFLQDVTLTTNLSKSNIQTTFPIDKMINKISILTLSQSKVVNGCYGHSTVIFKRPIIEGQYYLQFKIKRANLNQTKAKIQTPPAVRIGICQFNYSKNAPLGLDFSVGYKGSNGKFVFESHQNQGGEAFSEDDVIGLGISFSSPYKYPDRNQLWQQSFILITKNGKQVGKCSKIHQCFYCPAFSLYNYAAVQVRCDDQTFEYKLQGYKGYSSIFSQPIDYQFLKNTAQFAFGKLEESK